MKAKAVQSAFAFIFNYYVKSITKAHFIVKKHQIIFLLLLFLPNVLFSQEVQVTDIKKISLSEAAYFPTFGKSDEELLLTSKNYKGLKIYSLKTGKLTPVTNATGAGSDPQFTCSGDLLVPVFEYKKGRKHINYKVFSPDGKEKPSLKSAPAQTYPKVSVKGKEINVFFEDGKTASYSPVGDYFYVWASFSPDKQKILFTAAGKGTFVMNTDGEIKQELGYLNAPEWINNQWVTGMADKDDGKVVTESNIMAIHVSTGEKFNLTKNRDIVAMYPAPSPGAGKIAFHNPEGEVYVLDIELTE